MCTRQKTAGWVTTCAGCLKPQTTTGAILTKGSVLMRCKSGPESGSNSLHSPCRDLAQHPDTFKDSICGFSQLGTQWTSACEWHRLEVLQLNIWQSQKQAGTQMGQTCTSCELLFTWQLWTAKAYILSYGSGQSIQHYPHPQQITVVCTAWDVCMKQWLHVVSCDWNIYKVIKHSCELFVIGKCPWGEPT